MGWTVRSNHFGEIAGRLPRALDGAVVDLANDLSDVLRATVWKRTGVLSTAISVDDAIPLHAQVKVGYYLGRGFYSGFQEFGSRRQGARPIVGPAAHEAEPIFAAYVEKAIREAVRV